MASGGSRRKEQLSGDSGGVANCNNKDGMGDLLLLLLSKDDDGGGSDDLGTDETL